MRSLTNIASSHLVLGTLLALLWCAFECSTQLQQGFLTTPSTKYSNTTETSTSTSLLGAEDFITAGQTESSVTLQRKNMGIKNATPFTVSESIRSTGVPLTAVIALPDATDFKAFGQNESSITLQWKKVENYSDYIIKYLQKQILVSASEEQVKHTIHDLQPATEYNFTLLTFFENNNSTGVSLLAVTAPSDAKDFTSADQNETSIMLQWKKVGEVLNYQIKFNDSNITATASMDREQVDHTISGLQNATTYNFTLFTVFKNVTSKGVPHTAVTAPKKAEDVKQVDQNETSITLQWTSMGQHLKYQIEFSGTNISVPALEAGQQVNRTISGLLNATIYHFTLFTVFDYARSEGVPLTAVTAPVNAELFQVVGQNESSITVEWIKVGDLLNYTIKYGDEQINVTATDDQKQVKHTIPELTSATKYNFTLFTYFQNVPSSGIDLNAVTAPINVKHVTILTQNESSITLQWEKVDNISTYVLKYDCSFREIDANPQKASQTRVVSGLDPGRKYNFSVTAVFENVSSTGYTFDAATAPSMVDSVDVTERTTNTITLRWNIRSNWAYVLKINGKDTDIVKSSDPLIYQVKDLKPGTEYEFILITKFSGIQSKAYTDFTVTTIACSDVSWHVSNSSIQGMVKGLFSKVTATNGSRPHISPTGENVTFTGLYPGSTYRLYFEYEKNSSIFPQCEHKLTTKPAHLQAGCDYWAAGYAILILWEEPQSIWTAVEINVSTIKCRLEVNDTKQYAIYGFQPAKLYEVSVALVRETEGETLRSEQPHIFQCQTDPRGVIAGAVVSVLFFCLVLLVVFFIWHKKPQFIRKKRLIDGDGISKTKPKPIPAATFSEHFSQLSADNNRLFSQEYENLMPVGTEQTRHAAINPDNKPLNRFTNVLPYDWCRVKLSTAHHTGSDYINASYMPGYNHHREYIAAQGPLPATVKDFWRMIWEQSAQRIIMVTNCVEDGRIKCEQYWPADSQPCLYGDLMVSITSEQKHPSWTLREFSVKHTKTSQVRTVKHFHYTAWPDHGVPQDTETVIQFRELFREHIDREGTGSPSVVHCSAGVGRTGTIISLDVLLQQLEQEGAVGINAFVRKMRQNRPHMVQTESQYIFLHCCIMSCLHSREKPEDNIYENVDMNVIYENATALNIIHSQKTNV